MRISRELLDDVIAHARDEAPNECCGVIATRNGSAVAVHRTRNLHASPLKFEIAPDDLLAVMRVIDDAGDEMGANYHSHTRSAPLPSQTDINLAERWPDPNLIYVIVGLENDVPDVRAWRIAHGQVQEEPLEVEG
jgi:proteasome lid subunit RPN8/RPN11